MLSRPDLLRGAVLLRPMVPFEPEALPDLSGVRIVVAAGEMDHMVPKENTERLVELLRDSGAEIQVRWQRTEYVLAREEVEEAKRWFSQAVYDETAGMG